ncbi:NAD(P)-dependent oxidoreductase [Psychromarinibacter sp. C21-152]|uniref:NAD(P)-dependent oxidoreductase n=1 Tax=Psychromarinibacter sediminicola TaxID=3033385 RepID=A0AAE3NRZ3_9RHOB|nr:NAD(P)-dependent oxidoreductase [Psychromarinibacter sediminicola]MDF0601384.1 NAD(P)-dependent oxidoreductase [Psychromarinibacter sediminicola]
MSRHDEQVDRATSGWAPSPRLTSDKRIAITGGSGRVGKAIRGALAGRVPSIRVVDIADPGALRANETWSKADISDRADLVRALVDVDAIVHLAGYPNERDIEEILRVNVLGTHNVFEAARENGIGRIVFGSTNHVVGFYPRETTVSPTDPMRPDSLYGLSKCWGELEAGLYYDKAGIRSLNIRIGNAAERPTDARAKAIWVAPDDLAQLVLIGLEHPDIRCETVFGVSETDGDWWDNGRAAELGYVPGCSAAAAAPEPLAERATELPEISEIFQGGRFCVAGHDGTLRHRRHR